MQSHELFMIILQGQGTYTGLEVTVFNNLEPI